MSHLMLDAPHLRWVVDIIRFHGHGKRFPGMAGVEPVTSYRILQKNGVSPRASMLMAIPATIWSARRRITKAPYRPASNKPAAMPTSG